YRLRLRQERATGFDRRRHPDSAIYPAVLDRALIVDPVRQRTDWAWRSHFCFLPFRERAKIDSLAVDLSPAMATEFRLPEVADSCRFYFAVAVAALVFVSGAVSAARSSF